MYLLGHTRLQESLYTPYDLGPEFTSMKKLGPGVKLPDIPLPSPPPRKSSPRRSPGAMDQTEGVRGRDGIQGVFQNTPPDAPKRRRITAAGQAHGQSVDGSGTLQLAGFEQHRPASAWEIVTISSQLAGLRGPALYRYVAQHVWPSDVNTAFYMEKPFEDALFHIATSDGTKAFHDEHLYVFLNVALQRGATAQRIFSAISNHVVDAAADTPCIWSLLYFITSVFEMDPEMIHLVNDPKLFHNLAQRGDFPCPGILFFFTKLAGYPVLIRQFRLILDKCTTILRSGFTDAEVRRNALIILERCVSEWYSVISDVLTNVSFTAWRDDLGTLLASMLSSTSVELVLSLESVNNLDSLIVFASKRDDKVWKSVLTLLRLQWPQKVASVLNEPTCTHVMTTLTCPITLQECVYPVVASDGHTYERDALMRHMGKCGAVSPITREAISYHMFPNRSVYDLEVA